MGQCSGCGKVFRHMDADECSKCLKRQGAGTDAAALQLVLTLLQCGGCGVTFKFLDSELCAVCDAKESGYETIGSGTAATRASSSGGHASARSVAASHHLQHACGQPVVSSLSRRMGSSVTRASPLRTISGNGAPNAPFVLADSSDIEVDDGDCDDTIKVEYDLDHGSIDKSISQHRKTASTYRLKTKSTGIPASPAQSKMLMTGRLSKLRANAQKAAASKTLVSSIQMLTFVCEVMLMGAKGKVVSARVPAMLCHIDMNVPTGALVDKILEELNSEDSQWRKAYGIIKLEDMCLAFKQKVSSQYPEMKLTGYGSIRQFWDFHTQKPGLYFTDVQIKNFSPVIVVIVTENSSTDNTASDGAQDRDKSCKRKRQLSTSLTPPPVKRERLDNVSMKVESDIKEEPVELKAIPRKQRSRQRRPFPVPAAPRVPIVLKRSITFSIHLPVCKDGLWSINELEAHYRGKLQSPLSGRPRELLVDEDAAVLLGGELFHVVDSDLQAGHQQIIHLAKLGDFLSQFMKELRSDGVHACNWFLDIEVPRHFIALEMEANTVATKALLCYDLVPCEDLSSSIAAEIHADVGDLTSALSHFSLHGSNGEVVYTSFKTSITEDGAKLQISDPAIHIASGQTSARNHGAEGIKAFRQHHACSRLCSKLGLQPFGDHEV